MIHVAGEFNPLTCLIGADERARAQADRAADLADAEAETHEIESGD